MFELLQRGLKVERQVSLPLVYQGHPLECGYRIDLLVESEVIVEVKAVERFVRVHPAQVLSCLRLSGCKNVQLSGSDVLSGFRMSG
jgi:GxxExxY protein